jgi:hypothetical protein
MKLKRMLLAVGVVVGMATAVGASTVTFDFSKADSGGWVSDLIYSKGALRLDVSGYDSTGMAGRVSTAKGQGLGLRSATDCRPLGVCSALDSQIDTTGRKDIAGLSFNRAVRLVGLTFSMVDTYDTFDFYLGKVKQYQASVKPSVGLQSPFDTSFGIGAGVSGRQICNPPHVKLGGPVCRTFWDFSAFRLTSVTVETASSVPLPAAAPMLVAGLGALVAARRRRRAR